jgi:CarboxypepD_reg-like domain
MLLRIVFFLLSISAFAQKTTLNGQIRDKNAEPVPFGSVRIKNSYLGTIADSLGRYSIKANLQKDVLVFSSVGYFDKTIVLKKQKVKTLDVTLEENKQEFSEVIIRPEENPAWKIVRKVLENRKINNPDLYDSYQARTYTKLEIIGDSLQNFKRNDSTKTRKKEYVSDMLIFEFASDLYNQKPGKKKETIFATHTNFLKTYGTYINAIPLDFHKFHFYEELYNFYLIKRIFINPINSKTFGQYDWEIMKIDTLGADTLFHLKFKPYNGQKFNGFTGSMIINADRYALQEIHLTSADSAQSFVIKIDQSYQKIQDKWFPMRAKTSIVGISKDERLKGKLQAEFITAFKDIKINEPINSKIFDDVQRELLNGSEKYNDSTFAQFRIDTLSSREKQMYKLYDSLSSRRKFSRIIKNAENKYSSQLINLIIGIVDLKIAEINLFQTFRLNYIEGFNISLALQSKLILKPRFGFHFNPSYGLKDQKFKLNTDFSWFITKDRYNKITFGYKNNYESNLRYNTELGPNIMADYSYQYMPTLAKDLDFTKINQINRKYAELYIRPLRYNWVRFQINQTAFNANILKDKSSYKLSEISVNWRLAYKEVINRTGRLETTVNRFYPIVYFNVTKGFSLWQSTHQYWKFMINNTFQIRFKKAGILDLNHIATYNTGSMPTDLLLPTSFNRIGIKEPENVAMAYAQSTKQGVLNSTFVFKHDFNNILFKPKTKYSQPRISIQNTISNSKLSLYTAENERKNFNISGYSTGITLRNLIRIPVKGYYIGLGPSIDFTYGPNAPSIIKNRFRIGLRLF